ncbi:protein kinase [Rhodococcus oxybenzonivorans]|uniref:Protein kinase n=1 Tax=Rhodococcus oxybenzonivorans TaxID=1990687 RepID=A0A2S2BR63_9NOCA|nr:protein kinase [Rhodococcus oxybenzonivorans]AWK71120.1 protein kinase [Rhodococcus oxybenzonivorans]
MADLDPLATQRAVTSSLTAELEAAGFEDAVEIGRGGFGVVYRCRQPALDRSVAVKVLTADLDDENRERFLREQRAMGRLTGHPNIVNVLGVGTTSSGRPYLVMPYYAQDSLDAMIRRQGPLSLEQVLRLGVKVAASLETAHRIGIVHRDVKPTNILLTDYGEPALTDFGIAHITGGFETATGVVTGSPAFTAPEVLAGRSPSPAADIYSLGATLFCAATGHAAVERRRGEQVVAQFIRLRSEPIPNLREQGLPGDVSAAIEQAMSAVSHRPSAAGLGEQLQEAQSRHGFQVDDMALQSRTGERPGLYASSRSARPSAMNREDDRLGNLPAELTSFVGRRRELVETKTLLSQSRLVTLTGIGGAGKTRLALRVAAQARREFPDGVWLVELGELRDGSLLIDVVSGALGLRDQSARRVQDVLVDFLGSKQLLMVLDNCEQVVDAVAKMAETLLRTCPKLQILATSREALAVGGESVLRVPPLPVPDTDRSTSREGLSNSEAVTLFVERARTAVPGFTLTEENQAAVAGICRRLDGLPLPIELAAARLRMMSAEQILQRLSDRYALLTGGARSASTRQQTLRLCVDWSYDLCTPLEKVGWARLSVFAGSFELDAAEAICGYDLTSPSLLDVVTSLLDKSILIREGSADGVRFRLLETLRSYGREKAQASGHYDDLRTRHRNWYQQLVIDAADDWISPRQLEWIDRLEREKSNLREAMQFCASADPATGLRIADALLDFWNTRSMFREGRYWLDRLLEGADKQPTPERVKALYANSLLAETQGDVMRANELVEEARRLGNQGTDPRMSSYVTFADGLNAMFNGDIARACSLLEVSVTDFAEQKDLTVQIKAMTLLGLAYESRGDIEKAISCFEGVLAITRSRGESVHQAYALWSLGVALWRQGDLHRSAMQLQQALRLAQLANNQVSAGACLETLAWIASGEEDFHRAAVLMGATETLSRAVGGSSVYLPKLLEYHNDCEQNTRRALGTKAFDAAREEGNALLFDDAIDYALGTVRSGRADPSRTTSGLTKREQQVAELVTRGLTNKEIAAELVISPRTARGHVEHILAKLGFTSRAQIAAWTVDRSRSSWRG